jgi:hypothetical protein
MSAPSLSHGFSHRFNPQKPMDTFLKPQTEEKKKKEGREERFTK